MTRSFVVSLFWLAFGILVVSTAIGLVTLWPEDRTVEQPPGLARPKTLGAKIVAIAATPCRAPGQSGCRPVTVKLKERKDAGGRETDGDGPCGVSKFSARSRKTRICR